MIIEVATWSKRTPVLINTEQVVSVRDGDLNRDPTVVKLSTGERLEVLEKVQDIKRLMEAAND